MDRLKELKERTRVWYPNFPRDLALWCEEEIEKLRKRVEELETREVGTGDQNEILFCS